MLKRIRKVKNLKNKKVLLRGDLDVAIENGKIKDDFRLKRLVPTIKYLLKQKTEVIIMGHLGRPYGKFNNEFSMRPIAEKFKNLMKVSFEKNKTKTKTKNKLKKEKSNKTAATEWGDLEENENFYSYDISPDISLLENLRFYPGEEKNDENFSKKLASLGDVYVNDAFSVSHRKHSSVFGIAKFLPSYAGLNLEQEIENLSKCLRNPKKPAIAIMGGAKIETKLPLIEKMSKIFDYVLVGGKLGLEIKSLNKKLDNNIILPLDYAEGDFDIGKETIKSFKKIIQNSKTVVWNGPLGKFEEKKYLKGTKEIANSVLESGAYSIIGGGDTIAALNNLKILEKFCFVSTGGGAMLEFLEKGNLPAIEVLGFEN